MARVTCIGVDLNTNRVLVESERFSDLCVALPYADSLRASMPELSGLLDWTITVTSEGSVVERWSMDDNSTVLPHRGLIEENVDAYVHRAIQLIEDAK